ncbi:MAG: hypothetical protein ACO3CR_05090 [Solirubrobacterales bacterium]
MPEESGKVGGRLTVLVANVDLLILAVALPVFIALGEAVAWLVAATLWIVARLISGFAAAKARQKLAQGERNTALGTVAATSLGRVWLIAIAILIAGVIDRDTGLYAALLLVILFTVNLATRGLVHLIESDRSA